MDSTLLAILEADNPWLRGDPDLERWVRRRLPERWIERAADTSSWGGAEQAHLVVGPRQAGKSSLVWQHVGKLGGPVLFLDCEQALVRRWCSSAALFLRDVEGLVPPGTPLFFEEVQHLEDAALFLKGLVDRRPGAPLLVTGSASFQLGSGTRESLAGRATRTRLLTLSGAEVTADHGTLPEVLRRQRVEETLERHRVVGGYPEAWTSERPGEVLARLVEAFVLRDASDLHRIARPDAFRRLMRLVALQTGSLVNLSEWASVLGIARDTVAAYLELLADAHVLAELRPFAGGRRVEVTSRPKVYFLDPGLRNQILGDLRPWSTRADRGPLLETWVLSEVAKAMPHQHALHFWRSGSGAEVDFVVDRGRDLLAVEVKASELARPTVPRSARSFVQAYRPAELWIVNLALSLADRLGSTRLRWMTPDEFVQAAAAGT